ncbi:Stromal interaction molecule 1 [Hypsibius exemplaris]|uniref:Stromal interaction molecule 1 n=1 Tax=Hypsibius exemplaris TaxID=2072580 RepID=A0A1W0WYD3_HYPEX|nr:Stromal interaction molecule 1 [Hypsibius exemplaris]
MTSCKRRFFIFSLCLASLSCATWLGVRAVEDNLEKNGQSNQISQSSEPGKGEFESIQFLHKLLDEDLSGYVDVRESKEFLNDELNVKGKSKDRLNTFHQDDPQVTVEELWTSWTASEVHNWTVEQVVVWLIEHVELPQYAEVFRRFSVSGAQLPRMASNSPEYLTTILGIRDPIHKRKLSLKATDAVLFGSPKRDPFGAYKHWIFLTSIGIASCGIWFAYSQRRKYDRQMQQVSADLENFQQLERQLSSLQEKVGKSETAESNNGDKSLSSSVEGTRLQEAEEELNVLRDALQRAEHRAESRAFNVPAELEMHLRKTYTVELSYFRSKRAAAEKQLQAAKEECEKLYKKQQGVFGPFRVAHGSQLDTVDDGLVVAKAALTELASDMDERSKRWGRMEILTGLNIVSPNPAADGSYLRRQFLPSSSSSAEFPDHSSSTSSSRVSAGVSGGGSGGGPNETEYDRYGRRVSWEPDTFSVNSYDSMPVNISETKKFGDGGQKASISGEVRARPQQRISPEPPGVVNGGLGRSGRPTAPIPCDDEERAARKVPDGFVDLDAVSIISGSVSGGGETTVKKRSGLKKIFGK